MNVLVATSEHGYSIYDQNKSLQKLRKAKSVYEKMQDDIPAADGSRVKFIVVPDGTIEPQSGKSFLQSLHNFCSDPERLEGKIQSVRRLGVT